MSEDTHKSLQEAPGTTSEDTMVELDAFDGDTQDAVPGAGGRDKLVALFGAISVCILVVAAATLTWAQQAPPVAVAVAPPPVDMPEPPSTPNPFMSTALKAKAAIVYDVHAGMSLYASNADTQLPLASLTKLMTSLVAFESAAPDTRVAVTPYAVETEGDSGLLTNETWKLGKLISFTLLTSSNDGADALAAAVGDIWQTTPEVSPEYVRVDSFVEHMNKRARELGLTEMKFRNPSGLDEGVGQEGGLGSADDVAHLLAYIWENHPEILADTASLEHSYISEDGILHTGENTNERVYKTPGLLGSKTGYTDLAGGNLGIIFDAGMDHPLVVVVLGSTREGRFDDVDALVKATYQYVESGWYAYEVAGSTPRG
jgi:D-alanyl-D-alanine carboxypeptidase (penicillin-binding protein 5/6)